MFSASELRFVRTLAELIECNPFLPRRIELERKALGKDFVQRNSDWNVHPSQHHDSENLRRLYSRARDLLHNKNVGEAELNDATYTLYLDLVRFVLFDDYRRDFEKLVHDKNASTKPVYQRFCKDWQRYCPADVMGSDGNRQMPHYFATIFQVRRAFNNIFQHIIGSCQATIDLRAEIWRSIFTHNMRRFDNGLFEAMSHFPTLITGPTGSGKELVARAIGLSGYIPLDLKTSIWQTRPSETFVSLNLSALSPTLIESELFGHQQGAFTGATTDRVGWLETCPEHGSVFLDEIGELAPEIQVKLLRVFEERQFQRLGDTQPRPFRGRIIAATNRDLADEVHHNRFRQDFYYRLCADRIQTPSLFQRCQEDPQELAHLVDHIISRILPSPQRDQAAKQCVTWIAQHLDQHTWPGNVRELDQCVRSWLLRENYQPLEQRTDSRDAGGLRTALAKAQLSADELLTLYCQVKYSQNQSYVKTAAALGIDRRTVKSRVS